MNEEKHVDSEAPKGAEEMTSAELDQVAGGTGELSADDSLRLQAYMDQRSKLESTLSNIMKTTSDTASSITQNLK